MAEKKIFFYYTNHPSDKWGKEQISSAFFRGRLKQKYFDFSFRQIQKLLKNFSQQKIRWT